MCDLSAAVRAGETIVAANECLLLPFLRLITMVHQWLVRHRAFVIENFF